GFAYTPYSIFLSLSTVGIPAAVSKFVSKYNSLDDYQTGMRIFKVGSILMLGTGIAAFLVMFFSADVLANWSISNVDSKGIKSGDVAYYIRMVSIAIIIIPAMRIIQDFFQ